MKTLRIVLLAVLVLSLVLGYGLKKLFPKERVDESIYLAEVAPGFAFSEKTGVPPHYSSAQGVVAFNTYDVTPEIRGYAGPIRMLIALDKDGRITGIRILEHEETPNYVHSMETPGFLRQFLGKTVNDPLEVDRDIDGISRATVSVKALADTVRESSRKVASTALGIQVHGSEKREAGSMNWIAYGALYAVAIAVYFLSRRRRLPDAFRDVILLVALLVVGVWLSAPFSIIHVFNVLLMRFSGDALWLIVVIGTVVSVAVAGRFYCGWLCPFGAASEFIGRLPTKKWEVPVALDDRWRNAKYLLFAFAVLSAVPTGRTDFGNYETYVTLFSFHGNTLMWVLVALALVANLRVKRFWCRFLCPVAAFIGALSRRDKGYVSSPACPMANKPGPLTSECIRCNRCYAGARGK